MHAMTQKTLIAEANASLRQENIPTNPLSDVSLRYAVNVRSFPQVGVSAKNRTFAVVPDAADASERKVFFIDRKMA